MQTKYTADPAPLVYDDTVYLFTSHDEDDATGFTMYNWLLYTSKDLVNWTDHGVIGGVKDPNKTFKWADGNNAWAPQVAQRNGKFYLYAPFPKGGHMVIGVAVADRPEGPYVDAIGAPLIDNPSSSNDIDPTVFVDADGQGYLYWGHQPPVFYVKLNQDMISYSGGIVQLTRPQTYEEGPWFYQRDGKYYLAFASTCCPEGIGYAMSSSAGGPWTYQGSIMDGNAQSSGNHPGIIDFKGGSYVFGFDYAVQLAREGKRLGERRSVCVQQFSYGADGTIPKLPFWTDAGVAQVGSLDPYVQTEAETIAWAWDVKTETCSEGGMDVTGIEDGDYIKVKGVDFGAGARSLDVRTASASAGGDVEVHLDARSGALVGTCSVAATGGAQTWTTTSCDVAGATGVHDVFFVFSGGSGSLFNFNWWKFHAVDAGQAAGGAPGFGGGPASGGLAGASSAGIGPAGGASGGGASGGPATGGAGVSNGATAGRNMAGESSGGGVPSAGAGSLSAGHGGVGVEGGMAGSALAIAGAGGTAGAIATAGRSGDAGAPPPSDSRNDTKSGCGCRVSAGGVETVDPRAVGLLGALGVLLRRRLAKPRARRRAGNRLGATPRAS